MDLRERENVCGVTRRSRGNEICGWNVLEKSLFSRRVKITTKVRVKYAGLMNRIVI